MGKFTAALVKEKGVAFAIVVVKPTALNYSDSKIEEVRASFINDFPGVPIILAVQNSKGLTYNGRSDIVKFLATLHYSQIPWKDYRN